MHHHFPREIWRRIFELDRTYHEWFQTRVLTELLLAVSKEMAELYFYFFMAPDRFYVKTYGPKSFRYALDPSTTWHTVEWFTENDSVVFRTYNERTGSWFDSRL